MKKILNYFGLIKIVDHKDEISKIKDEHKKNISKVETELDISENSCTKAINLSEALKSEVKKSEEDMNKLNLTIQQKDKIISDLKVDILETNKRVEKYKRENSHYIKQKHILSEENINLKNEVKTLKENNIIQKRVTDGRIGGYVKEINKIKAAYLFVLSIIFKDFKLFKDTEVFLGNEYKKLKLWDKKRKKEVVGDKIDQ